MAATATPRRVCTHDLLAGCADAQAQLSADVAARGYAILRLSAKAAAPLEAAAAAATAFFKLPPTKKEATRCLFDEAMVDAKGLVGYNMVTPAKAVFRIRRQYTTGGSEPSEGSNSTISKKKRRTADPGSVVWPAESDLPCFRQDVEAAWVLLERLQSCCSVALLGEQYRRWEAEHGRVLPGQRWSASPLDLFLYPNDGWAAKTVNCTEHKDPGLLSLIPCSTVPGLQVRAHGTETEGLADDEQQTQQMRWVAVEELPGALPHRDVVVFPGVEMETLTNGRLGATLHGVAKAAVPRISIVYERRAQITCYGSGAQTRAVAQQQQQQQLDRDSVRLPEMMVAVEKKHRMLKGNKTEEPKRGQEDEENTEDYWCPVGCACPTCDPVAWKAEGERLEIQQGLRCDICRRLLVTSFQAARCIC